MIELSNGVDVGSAAGRVRVLTWIARVVFVAGLVVLAVGVHTDAVTIDRSALGFLLWLVFGGLVLSGVVNLFARPAATIAALPGASRAGLEHERTSA